jgi:hypothetical protein
VVLSAAVSKSPSPRLTRSSSRAHSGDLETDAGALFGFSTLTTAPLVEGAGGADRVDVGVEADAGGRWSPLLAVPADGDVATSGATGGGEFGAFEADAGCGVGEVCEAALVDVRLTTK